MTTKSCIYAIIHTETKRCYIGSTVNYENRKWKHITTLRSEKHHSPHLQSSWSKYGEEAFEFNIIQKIEHDHELIVWEQFWIDKLKPIFNVAKIAGSPLGVIRSKETKHRMSLAKRGVKIQMTERKLKAIEAQRGIPRTPEQIARQVNARKKRLVTLINREGDIFTTYNLAAFAREHGLNKSSLGAILYGKATHHRGWKCSLNIISLPLDRPHPASL